MKITFSDSSNELVVSYRGFKTTIGLDSSVFSNCEKFVSRIKEFNLEKLSVDDLAEINKIVHGLRDSLNVNIKKKNAEALKKALGEVHAAIIIFKVAIPCISGEASGVAVEEVANC